MKYQKLFHIWNDQIIILVEYEIATSNCRERLFHQRKYLWLLLKLKQKHSQPHVGLEAKSMHEIYWNTTQKLIQMWYLPQHIPRNAYVLATVRVKGNPLIRLNSYFYK